MSAPAGGYPATSNIGQGNPNVSLSPQGVQTSQNNGVGANAPQQELPNGAAVRQGPKGPMHKHPGYADAAGHLKWHPVSQRHGRGTEQMHEDAGLGADGLGSTPEMRMAVGANMKEGGGLIKPPSTADKHPVATIGAHVGLAALETIANTAGKGMSAVTNFTRAVLSGNPLSPASSLLADTFDGMASVKQSLDNTYRKYGIDPGADMASIKDTVRGGLASKQVEAQNAGYQRAFDNIDQKLADIAGSPDADITQLGPNQLDLYYQTLSEDADRLLQDYNDAREKGTLTPEMQRAYDAEIEVYASAFGVIAKQGEANKKKYSELARDLKAQRASERAKVREQQEQEKQNRLASHAARYQRAVDTGDFATRVLYDMGDKGYDAELTPDGVPVDNALRAKYEKALQDKLDSKMYSDEENASMQARLNASKTYSLNQKLKEKKQKRTASMERDWGADGLNVVDLVYDQNNALGRTNKHGVVVGDKISPRLHNDLYAAAMDRVEALKANGMTEEQAMKDPEVRRALTASRLQEWTYDTYKVIPELTRIPQATLDEKGKTVEDVDAAKKEIYDKYNELMGKYSFVTDDPSTWNGPLPTSQDRTDFKRLVDQTRREFGIWKEKKSKGEGEAPVEKPASQETQEKPMDIWLSEPKGQTPTGQRIQSGDTGKVYEPEQIEVAAGKALSGGRNNAQTQMLIKFMDIAPGINENDNLSNPSYKQRREVILKWPDEIKEMKAEGDPKKGAVADEMTKYLDFVYQDQAWRDFLSTTRNGDPQLNQKYAGYNDFLEQAHRNLADPDTGELNLDDLPDIGTRKAALKAEYSNVEPENIGKPVKIEEKQAENVENQAETSENAEEQAENPQNPEEIPENVEDSDENEVKFDFSGRDNDQLSKEYDEIWAQWDRLNEMDAVNGLSEEESKKRDQLELYLTAYMDEIGRRNAENEQESAENPAKIDENTPENSEKINENTPENPAKIDENKVELPRLGGRNRVRLDNRQLMYISTPEQMAGLRLHEDDIKNLSNDDLDTLRNRYVEGAAKIKDAANATVADSKGKLSLANPEVKKQYDAIVKNLKDIKKVINARSKAKNEHDDAVHSEDEKRLYGKDKFAAKTKEYTKESGRKGSKTPPNDAHTSPFVVEGIAEPQNASWEHIKGKKKDTQAIADAALRYDPTGQNNPIIPEDADLEGVDVSKTVNRMRDATMSLRKYLALTASSIGDEDMEDEAYLTKNPWQTAERFCEKYAESSPDSVKDLRQRVSDSYNAIREQFEKETDKKTISHRQAQAERRANEQAARTEGAEQGESQHKPLDTRVQNERIMSVNQGIRANIKSIADSAMSKLNPRGLSEEEVNNRYMKVKAKQREALALLDEIMNSDAEYELKMQSMSMLADEYEKLMNDYIMKSYTLDAIDFDMLPNELRKSFENEFDRMTVHLAGYASLHPDIVPGHTVASTVDIMLRSPELLNDNYHRYVSEVVGGFRRRVETMLYESLNSEQN